MSRRLRLLVLLGLLATTAGVFLLRLPTWSASLLAYTLTGFFHRPSSVAAVRFHLWPLELEIVDLRVAGITPEALPFLEIPRARVTPSLTPLWAGDIVLSRVRLTGLRAHIHAFPEGGDDIPKMGGGRGGGPALRVGRLVIEEGEFSLNHERVPLVLDLPNFRGRLTRTSEGALAGKVSFGPGSVRFGSAPVLPLSTEIDLRLLGARITVEKGRLQGEGIDLVYRGRIQFGGRTQGQFTLAGPVDLDALERHVTRTGLGLKGDARYDGLISVDGSKLRIEGRLDGRRGVFDGVAVPRFAGYVAWDGDGLHVTRMDLDTLGGSATLDVEVPSSARRDRQVAIRGPLRGVDVEGLVRMIFDWGEFGVGSAATGEVDVRWPRGQARAISGRLALELEQRRDGRTPLEGRFEWSAVEGVQTLEKAELRAPETRARMKGRIERDDRTEIALDAESSDIAATDDLLLRLRRALGNAEAEKGGFSGSGVFRGRWRGTLGAPVFEGRFSGQEVGYLDVVWGRAEWVGVVDPDSVRSHSLVARRGASELWLDGEIETGFYAEKDALDVRVRFKEWPAPDLLKALTYDLDLTGPLTGEATYGGRRSAPIGSARLALAHGRYYGIDFTGLEASLRSRGTFTELRGGKARVGGGDVQFHGMVTDEGFFDGAVEVATVEAGALVSMMPGGASLGGKVSGRVLLQGLLSRPRMLASLTSPRLFVGDEGLGALEVTLTGRGDGSVTVKAECRSPRVDLGLEGSVAAAPPYDATLRLRARETSLDPFLRSTAFPALPAVVGIVATGSVDIRGPLARPRELRATTSVPELLVLLPEYPVRSQQPVIAELAAGRVELKEAHLAGEGTDLVVQGAADLLSPEGPLDLTLRGAADLRVLQVVTGRLRGRGAARLRLDVSGSRAAPRAQGTLALEGGGLRIRGFPQGIEDLRGTVEFTESAAEFAGITGSLGGGEVELEGEAAYGEGRLASFDVKLRGRGLGLRYPEGLRSSIDIELRSFGDGEIQWVTGVVDLRQAVWTRRYDLASELMAAGRTVEAPLALGDSVRYDIKIRAPGTFRIDNNLATLVARAELTVQGSAAAPVVVGRAEVERGRLYFLGQTYVIRRGIIDFASLQRIDPFFDIEAETRIRSYRVTLRVNGTLERITPTLASDPPLSTLQILNLLAGADESTVASLAQAQTNQDLLVATGAATLAAGRIVEEVGLERAAERVFGLNRFSIDPSLLKGSATTRVARVTVGKRITPDLNVLYAQDLNGLQDRVVSIEYTLSDRFSFLLTWSDLEGLGGDIRLRRSR